MSTVATSPATVPSTRRSKALHISLWVVQVLLGGAFLMAGVMKGTQPWDQVIANVGWAPVVGAPLTRFIGISELLAGLGLVLPALTRIRPVLTPLAAAGLVTIMVLAAGFHIVQGEPELILINVLLGGLAAIVAWGRFRAYPIAPRR